MNPAQNDVTDAVTECPPLTLLSSHSDLRFPKHEEIHIWRADAGSKQPPVGTAHTVQVIHRVAT